MAETPIRKFRIAPDVWEQFERLAAKNGETASSRIRRLITQDVRNSAPEEHS